MPRWTRYDPQVLEGAEKKLIEFTGIPIEKVKVPVDHYNFLYCLICGDPKNPPLVLLHGYGGSGLIFYKIIKDLASKHYLYIVDHLGMGRSSRPNFKAFDTSSAEAFFVEPIEQLRKAMGLNRFILAGHSFGGYIAGCYTLKYSEHVEKILFISAVGIPTQPKDYDFMSELKGDWKLRWIQKLVMFLWVRNITPAFIMRIMGPFGKLFLDHMIHDRATSIGKDEENVMINYLEQINLLPGSGEYGLAYVLYPGAWAKNPLCQRIHSLKIPMAFFYGDRDWVKPDGAEEMLEKSNGMVLIYTITGSDHHLYWDNPKELTEKIYHALETLE